MSDRAQNKIYAELIKKQVCIARCLTKKRSYQKNVHSFFSKKNLRIRIAYLVFSEIISVKKEMNNIHSKILISKLQ